MRAFACALVSVGWALSANLLVESPSLAQSTDPGTAQTVESPIGKVMTAIGAVTIEHTAIVAVQASLTSGPAPAKIGDFVYRGDVIQTGSDGKVGITFTDGTAFSISPNGRMVLNEYIYDPKGKSNSSLFSLTKGGLTFVAGAVAKTGDMKLDTPVATMGIRGTTPHVQILDNGTARFTTLVEETTITAPEQRGGSRDNQPTPQRRARSATPDELSAEEIAKYNKLFNMELKICRGC
jgi:hypothetical protein